jgi:hypothetical protein
MKPSTTEHLFPHPSPKNCEEQSAEVDFTLPINTEDKSTILLNVEVAVKDIVSKKARNKRSNY